MLQSWRWFGPDDPVTLEMIAQAGARGVVSSLHHVPVGEPWPLQEVLERKQQVEAAGLSWAVVESIPVHNDIKAGSSGRDRLIANYQESVRNVGEAGVEVVCYNFMPVVDWTRTQLDYRLPDSARALRFEMADFAAYDVYILQREQAEADYPPEVLDRARARFQAMTEVEREALERNIIAGLPGGADALGREDIRRSIAGFNALGEDGLRANLRKFLEAVVPVAEEAGVRLCIHPDDPPFSLFGLPRVISTAGDARTLLDAVPSPSNGLTLCAGSFGARADNDLVAMAREFGPRVHFVHLRNIRREEDGSFFESEHLGGDNDMVGLVEALLDEEERRRAEGRADIIPMRPDHGHLIGDEIGREDVNPGYSYNGRLKGLAELRGVIHALESLRGRGQ